MKKIGFLMDAVEDIKVETDSSVALMEEALKRGYEIYYFEQKNLLCLDSQVFAEAKKLKKWFEIEKSEKISLENLEMIFMRKDPPVDMEYIYTTHLLELVEKKGVKIINKPQALRDINEKLFITHFPQCCVPTLVSSSKAELMVFLKEHQDIILKPLNAMGGRSIFRVRQNDPNINVILETMTQDFTFHIMAQKYIHEIKNGDKRIILMHGKPLPYAISRLALEGETRANLAAGGSFKKATLTERDQWICDQLSKILLEKGIYFAGIDIIGDYLTEINITSPTCLREINEAHGVNTAAMFFDN